LVLGYENTEIGRGGAGGMNASPSPDVQCEQANTEDFPDNTFPHQEPEPGLRRKEDGD